MKDERRKSKNASDYQSKKDIEKQKLYKEEVDLLETRID